MVIWSFYLSKSYSIFQASDFYGGFMGYKNRKNPDFIDEIRVFLRWRTGYHGKLIILNHQVP